MFRAGSRIALAAAVVVAAGAIALGISVGGSGPSHGRGPLAAAMSSLPQSTVVAGFTDWAYVAQRGSFETVRQRDLVTRSALAEVAPGLASALGVRLRDLQWEVYGQGGFGEAVVVRLKRAVPSAARLRKAGYRQDRSTSIWSATGRLAAEEPIYGHVAILPKDDVLILGAKRGSVGWVAGVARGTGASFVQSRAAAAVVTSLAGTHTTFIQMGDLGCQATEAGREPDTERQAIAAQQRFGYVEGYSMLGRGLRDSSGGTQRFLVAMTFPSASVAAEQARTRSALSHGPFIGRSGDMSEVLRLRSATSDGPTALLSYDHPADSEYLMTGQGPLLPASC